MAQTLLLLVFQQHNPVYICQIYSIKGQVSVRPSVYARNSRTAAFKVEGRQLRPDGRVNAVKCFCCE
jgi:hypothetical protein